MKRNLWILLIVLISTFLAVGTSTAWQGRMAGMGDPYGLVGDESDFLIHPAMLSDGKAMKFYGHYRYTYTDVISWDLDWDHPLAWRWYRASGDEHEHNALLGTTFALGPGRMGAFFSYDGQRNDYDRDWNAVFLPAEGEYDFENEFDNFALRILYGLPLNGFSVGGELGVAYREEESESYRRADPLATANIFADVYGLSPYDSDYWNTFLKGSIQGNIGKIHSALTIRGGYIVSGDNEWKTWNENPVGTTVFEVDQNGDVEGFNVGGDLWFRFPLCEGITLPHLIRIDYQEKERDGAGTDSAGFSNFYENTEKQLNIEAGGGFERKCAETDERLAAGIYYNYIKNKNDFFYKQSAVPAYKVIAENPNFLEHRVIAKFIWEKPLSSALEFRTAMNWFYGNLEKENKIKAGTQTIDYSMDGPHWGVDIFLGCTIALNSFSIEPFINGGYQEYDLDGDLDLDQPPNSLEGDANESREQWFIGGGFSVVFGN